MCLYVVVSDTNVEVGEKLAEGKTKVICKVKDVAGMVVIRSKDRITAGDGARAHDMAGKSVISTSTNCSVFELLNRAGVMDSLFDLLLTTHHLFVVQFVTTNMCWFVETYGHMKLVFTGD